MPVVAAEATVSVFTRTKKSRERVRRERSGQRHAAIETDRRRAHHDASVGDVAHRASTLTRNDDRSSSVTTAERERSKGRVRESRRVACQRSGRRKARPNARSAKQTARPAIEILRSGLIYRFRIEGLHADAPSDFDPGPLKCFHFYTSLTRGAHARPPVSFDLRSKQHLTGRVCVLGSVPPSRAYPFSPGDTRRVSETIPCCPAQRFATIDFTEVYAPLV